MNGLSGISMFIRYAVMGFISGGKTQVTISRAEWKTHFIDTKQSLGNGSEREAKMLARLRRRLPVRFSIDSLNWVGLSQFLLGKWDLRGESLLEDFFVQQRRTTTKVPTSDDFCSVPRCSPNPTIPDPHQRSATTPVCPNDFLGHRVDARPEDPVALRIDRSFHLRTH